MEEFVTPSQHRTCSRSPQKHHYLGLLEEVFNLWLEEKLEKNLISKPKDTGLGLVQSYNICLASVSIDHLLSSPSFIPGSSKASLVCTPSQKAAGSVHSPGQKQGTIFLWDWYSSWETPSLEWHELVLSGQLQVHSLLQKSLLMIGTF